MKAALSRFAGVAFWLAVGAVAARGQGNLLVNGSFEAPAVGAGVVQTVTPLDWVSSGGNEYVVSNGGNASLPPATDGAQLYYFFGGAISQGSLDLTAGGAYRLTFDLSKFGTLPSGAVVATVSDGTDTQTQSFSVSSNGWSGQSWDFAPADSSAYTLTLAAGPDSYPAIDRAELTQYSAVPEPANAALWGGLAALLGAVLRGCCWRSKRVGDNALHQGG